MTTPPPPEALQNGAFTSYFKLLTRGLDVLETVSRSLDHILATDYPSTVIGSTRSAAVISDRLLLNLPSTW
jgi:hypothetical protein